MKLNKFFRQYNNFLLPTVIFIVCALVTYYGIIPGVKSIQALYIEQKDLTLQVEAINKRAQILESLDENTLRSQVSALMTAVPSTKYLPSIFTTLDTIALESGVTINLMTITSGGNIATQSAQTTVTNDASNLIAIKFAAIGSIDQVKTFLDSVVSVRRLLRVNRFDMSIRPDSSSTISMDIDAFFAPLPKTLGKASDTLTGFSANEEELLVKLNNYRLISQDLSNYESLPPIIYGTKADPFKK